MTSRASIPDTPRVISPTPSAESSSAADSYFPPTTRSSTKRRTGGIKPVTSPPSEQSDDGATSDPDLRRSRSRDREETHRRMSGRGKRPSKRSIQSPSTPINGAPKTPNGKPIQPNGYLTPFSSVSPFGSRSPSPLGLIPLHKDWRRFIHKHEVPRKILHVSIGFFTLALYSRNYQTSQIHPPLFYALVPIAATDLLRHNWPPFNRFYVRVLGAFMREGEVHDKYNGVIWYLLGAWAALRFFPKDVGVMSIVLLSWCDTAASTVGRWLGRYTPRVRRGKSLAGSLAAFAVGVGAAAAFWGWWAPLCEAAGVQDTDAFAFQRRLSLPQSVRGLLGWKEGEGEVTGGAAVGLMSVVAGLVVSLSEAVDIGGLDDNITIPILCGIGLVGFLKVFGNA